MSATDRYWLVCRRRTVHSRGVVSVFAAPISGNSVGMSVLWAKTYGAAEGEVSDFKLQIKWSNYKFGKVDNRLQIGSPDSLFVRDERLR